MVVPRKGHLDAALHVVTHLKVRPNAQLVFDPTYQDIDLWLFKEHDWTRFYGVFEYRPKVCKNQIEPLRLAPSRDAHSKVTW